MSEVKQSATQEIIALLEQALVANEASPPLSPAEKERIRREQDEYDYDPPGYDADEPTGDDPYYPDDEDDEADGATDHEIIDAYLGEIEAACEADLAEADEDLDDLLVPVEPPPSLMIVSVLQENLKKALDLVVPFVARPAPLPVLANVLLEAIARKIASIVDGMDGIQRNHNGRYPAHSIDQVVSTVSPLVSAAGLRIKTEVLDIEPFAILANMPFWRESNGRQEQYKRDVHLFRMKLLFTVINGDTGECDRHQWTHVFEIGRSEQDQDCGSAVSYGTKDFLKRQFMIADDSDDPDFKAGGAQRVNPQSLDGQLAPIISIEPNTRKRSERSPGWFAKDESGRISIALWESSFKTIDMLLHWNSGTMLQILAENEDRHRFNAPLMLRVMAHQHGLSLAADGQLNTLENPAVADQFMQIAGNIIPGLSAEQAAEYLDVAQLADFQADMGSALQVVQTAKRYAGEANGEGDPLHSVHLPPNDAFGDF